MGFLNRLRSDLVKLLIIVLLGHIESKQGDGGSSMGGSLSGSCKTEGIL